MFVGTDDDPHVKSPAIISSDDDFANDDHASD